MQKRKNAPSMVPILITLVFFATNMSYLPRFTVMVVTQYISYPAWGGLILLMLLRKQGRMLPKQAFVEFSSLFLCIMLLLFYTLTLKNEYFNTGFIRCVMVSMFVYVMGMFVKAEGSICNKTDYFLRAFVLSTIILNIAIYFEYLQGQDLASEMYSYVSKNETAFLNITAIIILLFSDAFGEKKGIRLIFYTLGITMFSLMIALMRCRSMLVCIPIVFGFFLIRSKVSKKLKAVLILVLLGVAGLLLLNEQLFNTFVYGILFGGREATDLDSLSSGRISIIETALDIFGQHPWTGVGKSFTVDCMFVSVLMKYGLIVGTVFIFMSIYPLIWGMYRFKQYENDTLFWVFFLCGIAYIFGGFFEENAPFGPGVRCYMLWFLFGYLQTERTNYIQ